MNGSHLIERIPTRADFGRTDLQPGRMYELEFLKEEKAKRIARATDWRSTLLVPVPLNVTTFRQVTVRGNSGLLIVTTGEPAADGRPHRQGTMLMWTHGDRVFCIRGNLSAGDVIQMAESIPS